MNVGRPWVSSWTNFCPPCPPLTVEWQKSVCFSSESALSPIKATTNKWTNTPLTNCNDCGSYSSIFLSSQFLCSKVYSLITRHTVTLSLLKPRHIPRWNHDWPPFKIQVTSTRGYRDRLATISFWNFPKFTVPYTSKPWLVFLWPRLIPRASTVSGALPRTESSLLNSINWNSASSATRQWSSSRSSPPPSRWAPESFGVFKFQPLLLPEINFLIIFCSGDNLYPLEYLCCYTYHHLPHV